MTDPLTNEQAIIEHYETIGRDLVKLLGLKIKRSNGRIETSVGDKSYEGLGRTVARVVNNGLNS